MIKKILVPTDFSPASSLALSYAIWFADRVGAVVDVLHVVYPGADVMDFPAMSPQVALIQVENATTVMPAFTTEALTRLQTLQNLQHVPEIHKHIEVGTPVPTIASAAKDLHTDLIILATRGERNFLESAFGTVSTGIMRKSEIPVLVVPAEVPSIQLKVLGYATGFDDADPEHIQHALNILSPFQPTLKIVHVRGENDNQKDIDLQSLRTALTQKGVSSQVELYETNDEIIEEGLEYFISTHGIDMLVMYSPKRNLFERLGHMSLTKKMALFSHVPLLVMK